MMLEYKSVFEKNINPFVQAGIVAAGGIFIILISAGLKKLGWFNTKEVFPWEIAFSSILFFALFNALFGLAQKGNKNYFLHSIISFAGLVVIVCVIARITSGLTIDEAGSFRWILLIFTFSYLLIVSISNVMKFIVKLAQKQDAALRGEIVEDDEVEKN